MTERQKQMLKSRALMEFLNDYPDICMDDIAEYGLVKTLANNYKSLLFSLSHYVLFVCTKSNERYIYIPKERFRTEEKEDVDQT